jgi:hypothetical protein
MIYGPRSTLLRGAADAMNSGRNVVAQGMMADHLAGARRAQILQAASAMVNGGLPGQRMTNDSGARGASGLPHPLKTGIEALSGVVMDDVRVHYNSAQPAQLRAHAFTQGHDIHVGPGQERHLPHEAWHVVQQAQGRVRGLWQTAGGVHINDDHMLESEADHYGARAMRARPAAEAAEPVAGPPIGGAVAQRTIIVGAGEDAETYEKDVGDWIDPKWGFNAEQKARYLAFLNDDHPHEFTTRQEMIAFFKNGLSAASSSITYSAPPSFSDQLAAAASRRAALSSSSAPAPVIKDYPGNTLGVEQELTGYKLKCEAANRGLIGEILSGTDLLVEFTTDMGSPLDGYTIELRTTPCEKANHVGVDARKRATGVMIRLIEEAAEQAEPEQRGVASGVHDGFRINILKPNFKIVREGGLGFSDQASLGVATEDLTGAAPSGDAALITAHGAWFNAGLHLPLTDADLAEPAKARRVYALVASTIAFLAQYMPGKAEDKGPNIVSPEIKNAWGTLPRTPPWDWLDVLGRNDRRTVIEAIKAAFSSGYANRAALQYIESRQDLAGHRVPAATIAGRPSSIFEFRTVPQALTPHLFGTPPVEASSGPRAIPSHLSDALARLRRQAGASDDSDSSSDSDEESDSKG